MAGPSLAKQLVVTVVLLVLAGRTGATEFVFSGFFARENVTTSGAATPPSAPLHSGLGNRYASKMAERAFNMSEAADPQPLLRPAAGGHPRLRVRRPTSLPPAAKLSRADPTRRARATPGARGAAAEDDAAFSWASVVLPFLFPALGGLLFGYDIGATSGASISLQSADLSGTTWYSLSSVQLGLVASGSLYGALGGSILAYRIADFLGRRIELMTAAALYICGALVTGSAPNFVALIIGRLLYGFGNAWCPSVYCRDFSCTNTWNTDIFKGAVYRVRNTVWVPLIGSLEIDNVGGWRYMFGFSAPIAAIMAIGMWTLPPSPKWLLLRAVQGKGSVEDNKKKAIQALRKLRGRSASEKTAGFTAASDAARVSILIGLFKLLMTGVAVLKVDDIGRRPLLIGGVGGITLSLLLLAAYYKILNNFPFVAVGALLLYVGSYQVSFGPISWLMVSEIFPLRTRGRGISLAESLGAANVFFLFGAIALLALVFVILNVPETKGLSLEEIESKILK
ncbi:hypothetical protein PR202_gb10434 [Eleusine coracana subsp. coracana]|uniref:Major facilitator superfamily (MFS) profile domain-containing protein n=1 Tax=Eleusine coracana subsp. coracana TaxID=191504 RepID=A0AAV5EJW0_ELECO|nr:hypothetical protein PR202_gb10434 [Eleusine coracana subsp. coracana]